MSPRRLRLLVVTAFTECAAFLIVFTVSRALAEGEASLVRMGLLGGMFGLAATVSSVLGGYLSDHLGRRRTVVAGLATGLGAVALALLGFGSQSPPLFFGSYLLIGLAIGAVYPPVSAWLTQGQAAERSSKQTLRFLLRFSLAWNVGMVAGQMSGGWLFNARWPHAPLWLALGLLLVNLVLVLGFRRGVGDGARPQAIEPDEHVARRWEASAAFTRLCWLANIGGTFAMSMVMHLMPRLVVQLGISAEAQGLLLAGSRAVVIGTYLLMYFSQFWHYRFSTALAAQTLGLVGLLVLTQAQGLAGLALALVGVAVLVGYNYFAGIYYSSTRGGDEAKGAAMGLHEATLTAGMAGGPILGGLAGHYLGGRAPYFLAAGVLAVLIVLQWVMWLSFHRAGGTARARRTLQPATASPER